jgi:hypothetical protein
VHTHQPLAFTVKSLIIDPKVWQYGTGAMVFSSPVVLPNANIIVGR